MVERHVMKGFRLRGAVADLGRTVVVLLCHERW